MAKARAKNRKMMNMLAGVGHSADELYGLAYGGLRLTRAEMDELESACRTIKAFEAQGREQLAAE